MRIVMFCMPVALAACASGQPPTAMPTPGMANPATRYCAEQGGHSEIRRETGGETGYCHLPDGRVVDEWQLFREGHRDND